MPAFVDLNKRKEESEFGLHICQSSDALTLAHTWAESIPHLT